jgi:uncharacterized cupredoxin-like copper-binding protein
MRRTVLFSLLIIAVLALSACGSPAPAAEPTVPPEPTAQPTAAAPESTAPAATEVRPTQAPPPAEGPTRVEITLADNTLASSLTTFKAGTSYTFVISNNGRHEHNFNISPPVSVAGSINAALGGALLSVDETQIPPGGSTSVTFAFPDTAVGAALEFNCLIRRHYDDGMRLDITVTG